MFEKAKVFQKRLKSVENEVDLWEMAPICGEMVELFDKRLKNLESDLEIWEMAKIFRKRLRYIGNGLSI